MDADVSADRSYIAGMRHGFRLETADQLAEAIEARRPKRADIEHFTRKADDRAAEMADWRFCPSTHCERRQECCSPHECAAKRIAARSLPRPAPRIAAVVLGAAVWALIVLAASAAHAHLTPALIAEWGPDIMNDPAKRGWFRGVHSPHGVPCCDVADGHRTSYDIRSDGYWVPIDGEWRKVPDDSIVYNAGNPVGEAVVWWVKQGENTYYIRCFVPGGGV